MQYVARLSSEILIYAYKHLFIDSFCNMCCLEHPAAAGIPSDAVLGQVRNGKLIYGISGRLLRNVVGR